MQQEGSAARCRMMAWPARDNRATLTAPALQHASILAVN